MPEVPGRSFRGLALDNRGPIGYNIRMDEENGMEWDEGSDVDNWETEMVFQDHEGQEDEETKEWQSREDFGYFGEMGMNED